MCIDMSSSIIHPAVLSKCAKKVLYEELLASASRRFAPKLMDHLSVSFTPHVIFFLVGKRNRPLREAPCTAHMQARIHYTSNVVGVSACSGRPPELFRGFVGITCAGGASREPKGPDMLQNDPRNNIRSIF